jgi:outer membrane protein assembly factor BamB
VAAGSKGGIFCCNRYTGQLYWKVMLGQPSGGSGPQTDAIAFAYNKVYVKYASPGVVPLHTTAALNAYNGDIEWIRPNPFGGESPISMANGVLFQSYNVGRVIEALDAMTGRKIWEAPMPSDVHAGASIANGAMYIGNGEGQSFKEEAAKKASYAYSMHCFTIDGK